MLLIPLHSVFRQEKEEKDMPVTTVFVKRESLSITLQENVKHTSLSTEYITYLAGPGVPVKQTKKPKK